MPKLSYGRLKSKGGAQPSLGVRFAASETGLHGAAVDAALRLIREGSSDVATRLEIETLRERFDSEYLRYQEQDEPDPNPVVLLQFQKARAAAALVYALSADSEQLHEALYEAAFAFSDQACVVKRLESALSWDHPVLAAEQAVLWTWGPGVARRGSEIIR